MLSTPFAVESRREKKMHWLAAILTRHTCCRTDCVLVLATAFCCTSAFCSTSPHIRSLFFFPFYFLLAAQSKRKGLEHASTFMREDNGAGSNGMSTATKGALDSRKEKRNREKKGKLHVHLHVWLQYCAPSCITTMRCAYTCQNGPLTGPCF